MDFNDPTPQNLQPAPAMTPALPDQRENPVFNLLDVAVIVGIAIVALFGAIFVALIVFSIAHPSRMDPKDVAGNALLIIPSQVAAYVLTVGFMVLYVWERYRIGLPKAIHWNMPRGKPVWGALMAGPALAALSQFLGFVLHRWVPKSLPLEEFFRTPGSAYLLAGFGILIAPLVEEIFFRGFLYPALARPIGVGPAVVITSVFFALLHASQLANAWAPLLILFTVSAVLTVVRAVSKSVATCVLIHTGYNFTLFAIMFVATQGFHHMERAAL